jgi:hypothetical protein
MKIGLGSLEEALEVLGQLLSDRGFYYEVVAVGGGGLLLLGLIDRTTKDLDVVALVKERELLSADPLPEALIRAAEEVGNALELGENWLNTGPASLLKMGLPQGFIDRLHIRKYKGLTIHLADRFDQICLKLYASVDQGPESKHFADLLALTPTPDELDQAKNWCLTQDVSADFEKEIKLAIENINAIS